MQQVSTATLLNFAKFRSSDKPPASAVLQTSVRSKAAIEWYGPDRPKFLGKQSSTDRGFVTRARVVRVV